MMAMMTRTPTATRFAIAAAVLMAASAAISAYWAAGGTGLLDTVGGSIARWGREGGVDVRLALALIVVLKLARRGFRSPLCARAGRRSVGWRGWRP